MVAAIFWKSLDSLINPDLSIRDQFKKRIQNIPILFFGLLNPAFITMVRARFDSYEEVIAYAEINFHYGHRSEIEKLVAKTAEVAQEELMRMRRTTGPLLPAEYNCRDKETKYGIPSNNEGWDMSASCTVNLVTTHFLDAPDCIAIHVEPIGGAPGWMEKIYSDEEIEVKNGLEKMRRISDVRTGFGKVITFCTDRKEIFKGDNGQQIKLISVKWSNLQRHPNLSTPPLRLIMLKKVQEHL